MQRLFKVIPLNPINTVHSIKKNDRWKHIFPKGESYRMKYYGPAYRGILEEDVLVFSDAAVKAADGKVSYSFLLKSKGLILYVGACQGPKVFSFKEAEAVVAFFALMISKDKGFDLQSLCFDGC